MPNPSLLSRLQRFAETTAFALFALMWASSFTSGCQSAPTESAKSEDNGNPPIVQDTMAVRYGSPQPLDTLVAKYGAPTPKPTDSVKTLYGIPTPFDSLIARYGAPTPRPVDSVKTLYGIPTPVGRFGSSFHATDSSDTQEP